jgi:hypothetical protein
MGRHSIASEIFDDESKFDFGVPDSIKGVGVNSHPAGLGLGSSIQLFETEPTAEEQERRFGVQQWLVFICIVILAMMDSFNATFLIPALPVSFSRSLKRPTSVLNHAMSRKYQIHSANHWQAHSGSTRYTYYSAQQVNYTSP